MPREPLNIVINDGDRISFTYTNYQDETRKRTVIYRGLRFGITEHHPKPAQWFLRCWDLDKDDWRMFPLSEIDARSITHE
jgi:predicted DNA-binding transcriptional regulator YafY